jgi:endonuclease G
MIAALPIALGLAAAGLELAGGGVEPGVVRPELDRAEVLASFTTTERELIDEHVFGGLPSLQNVDVRQGYVRGYLPEARVPLWVAYHVTPEYLDTPSREGRFSRFRRDPDVENAVVDNDYTGLKAARGMVRGHLAPYAVMGGDRDEDGRLAEEDEDDAETVFEANYMSNIAPQHHDAFNGAGGLWFALERRVQERWVRDRGGDVWVFAGSVIGPGDHERVGPENDILVPPMFFKIVVREPTEEELDEGDDLPKVLAFLFPHQRQAHGDLEDFLVTVDVIEALTGLDFFSELNDEVEGVLEDVDTIANWGVFAPAVDPPVTPES